MSAEPVRRRKNRKTNTSLGIPHTFSFPLLPTHECRAVNLHMMTLKILFHMDVKWGTQKSTQDLFLDNETRKRDALQNHAGTRRRRPGTVKASVRLRSILSAPFSELVALFFKGGRAPSVPSDTMKKRVRSPSGGSRREYRNPRCGP